MEALYLAGTAHFDRKGPERLLKFLSYIRPGHILCEGTEEEARIILEDRQKIEEILTKQKESEERFKSLEAITGTIYHEREEGKKLRLVLEVAKAVGYENWISYKHQKLYPGATIVHFDDPKLKKEALTNLVKELKSNGDGLEYFFDEQGIKISFFEALINSSIESVEEYVKLFDSYDTDNSLDLDSGEQTEEEKLFSDSLTTSRDLHFEKIIRQTMQIDSSMPSVAVLGCYHLFGPYHNLYERLKDLSPIRIKLKDIDNF